MSKDKEKDKDKDKDKDKEKGDRGLEDIPGTKLKTHGFSEELSSLKGPVGGAASFVEQAFWEQEIVNVAHVRSTSTFPVLSAHKRDLDPISDFTFVKFFDNKAVLVVADGCHWGLRSKEAAERATLGFMNYVVSQKAKDMKQAAQVLVKALYKGHEKITEGKEDVFSSGTTTLLGGMLVELTHEKEGRDKPKWAFICNNVGENKAYLWSPSTGKVTDITKGSIDTYSERDTGGRLGPYLDNGQPDLRNQKLYYSFCNEEDIILCLTDGIWANFCPERQGKSPVECGITSSSTWEGVVSPPDLALKSQLICHTLAQTISELGANSKSPTAIARKLTQQSVELTAKIREFMEKNPSMRAPTNKAEYPGRLDHATVLCVKVGSFRDGKLKDHESIWKYSSYSPVTKKNEEFIWPTKIEELLNAEKESQVTEFYLHLDSNILISISEACVLKCWTKMPKEGGASTPGLDGWREGSMLTLGEFSSKLDIGRWLKKNTMDAPGFSEDAVDKLLSSLEGMMPERDTLEVRKKKKQVKMPLSLLAAEETGEVIVENSLVQVFGKDNKSLGEYQMISIEGSKAEHVQFVVGNISKAKGWSSFSNNLGGLAELFSFVNTK